MPNTKTIQTKDVAGYVLLPGIIPRIRAFASSGFGYLAFLIALIYQGVRILPKDHPYCRYENVGRFGLRHVIAEAANRVTLNWKHADQVIIFIAILAGIVILIMQWVAIIAMLIGKTAWAGSGLSFGIFTTPFPETDIAFLLLDRVFGIPEFFGSAANAEIPTSFHYGLHALFQFYNSALLIIAVLIFLYFVLVVVAETAQSGTPFGRRFNHAFAPLRLVAALGLLVPLSYGFSASQYIAFFSARLGSGMATNGWIAYNQGLENALGVADKTLVARPVAPSIAGLVEYMSIASTCYEAYLTYKRQYDRLGGRDEGGTVIEPYLVKGNESMQVTEETTYEEARDFYKTGDDTIGGDIIIRYGEKHEKWEKYAGSVRPYCGELIVPIRVRNPESFEASNQAGAEFMQRTYFMLVDFLWYYDKLLDLGERVVRGEEDSCYYEERIGDSATCKSNKFPPDAYRQMIINEMETIVKANVEMAYTAMTSDLDFSVSFEILQRGWGGAGIWYNKIAEVNGAFFSAVYNIPSAKTYPELMEYVLTERRKQDQETTSAERYDPKLANNKKVSFEDPVDEKIAKFLSEQYKYWRKESQSEDKNLSGNIFFDTINALFGTEGLFNIRDNDVDDIHPLAQLVGIGKGLVESAIRNLAYAMGFAFFGGALGILGEHLSAGPILGAMSSFFVTIATISLTAGFVLFYVVPFLPFLYFYFAVAAWVKTIFEAVVGAPLWALAHLRIDGDGFPGKAASDGYFLMFEIFVRPILTVFGLIGGVAIFTALVKILNEVFDLVIDNLTGFDTTGYLEAQSDPDAARRYEESTGIDITESIRFKRYVVDEFFFTIIYTVLVYMIGVSSFKMIDLVPNNILRWMGASVSSFGDSRQDPTQGLVQYAALGGAQIGGQLGQASTIGTKAAGEVVGGLGNILKRMGQQSQSGGQ